MTRIPIVYKLRRALIAEPHWAGAPKSGLNLLNTGPPHCRDLRVRVTGDKLHDLIESIATSMELLVTEPVANPSRRLVSRKTARCCEPAPGFLVIVAASLRAQQWGWDGLWCEVHGLVQPQRVQVGHAALQDVAALQLCPVRLVQVDSGIGARHRQVAGLAQVEPAVDEGAEGDCAVDVG